MPSLCLTSWLKELGGEKTEANRFLFICSYHQDSLAGKCGFQPEPAYTNLLEGRGISHSQTGRAGGRRTSDRLGTISALQRSSSPGFPASTGLVISRLQSSQDSYHFSVFASLLASFSMTGNSKSVSALGREYDHQSLLKFRSGFTSGSSHYQERIDSGALGPKIKRYIYIFLFFSGIFSDWPSVSQMLILQPIYSGWGQETDRYSQ